MNETELDVTRGGPTGFISMLEYELLERDRFAEQHQLVSGLNEEIAILDACLDDAVFLHKRALRHSRGLADLGPYPRSYCASGHSHRRELRSFHDASRTDVAAREMSGWTRLSANRPEC